MHFDFIPTAGENRRAAARTKMPSGIVSRLALNFYRALWENGRSVEQSAMVLSTVEAMTDADPVWTSESRHSNVAADAATREALHDRAAFRSSRSNVTGDLVPRPSERRHTEVCREEHFRRFGLDPDLRSVGRKGRLKAGSVLRITHNGNRGYVARLTTPCAQGRVPPRRPPADPVFPGLDRLCMTYLPDQSERRKSS